MKTMRMRDVGLNVAITLRVMSLRRLTHERCQERLNPLAEKLVTRERDGDVGRAGTTLAEVLMSLMIMSIGVMMVMHVFPVATLRTLEASKQTNSTITAFVAESLFDIDPQVVHNPDGTFPPGGADQTKSFYGHYVVDPLGWQELNESAGTPLPATPLVSPRDYFGTATSSTVNTPYPRRYTAASQFSIAYPTTVVDLVAARQRAADLVTQPDNWKLVTEAQADTGVSASTNIIALTLDSDADLTSATEDSNGNGTLDAGEDRNGNSVLDNILPGIRAIVFDIDGIHSEVRNLTAVTTSPPTVTWTDPLPVRFESGNIGKVRVEVANRVFTWMLSVRKRPSGPANVDVVVFYKRNLNNPEAEYVYPAQFRTYTLGANGVPGNVGDDDGINAAEDVGEIGYPNSDDLPNNRVPIDFSTLPAGSDPPVLKRGGFVYDTKNGLWYRVRAIESETATGAVLVLDKAIERNGTEDLNGNGTLDAGEDANGDNILQTGGIILHPDVANVFLRKSNP